MQTHGGVASTAMDWDPQAAPEISSRGACHHADGAQITCVGYQRYSESFTPGRVVHLSALRSNSRTTSRPSRMKGYLFLPPMTPGVRDSRVGTTHTREVIGGVHGMLMAA